MKLGIDVGSTTVKIVLIDKDEVIYSDYRRHSAKVRETITHIIKEVYDKYGDIDVTTSIAGSAGLGISETTGLPFVQEVIASTAALEKIAPETDVAIELGGEDAKIIFFGVHLEQRMNGTCAGGTGAFIDQMASLLNVSCLELNELAKSHERIYHIASRCGVFAKSDLQPLLNQGAQKQDLAASIFQAIVNQTIVGLAQGRPIKGNIAFLGGPLYFLSSLRDAFKTTLNLEDNQIIFPPNAHLVVAYGAALESEGTTPYKLSAVIKLLEKAEKITVKESDKEPLFEDEEDYQNFLNRHNKANVTLRSIDGYEGEAYLGIDCGSTTTKIVLIDQDDNLLYQFYAPNQGNPLEVVKNELKLIFEKCKDKITIKASAVTGYGEELIQKAFMIDFGYVETVAHFEAAKHFLSDVNYIIDIGGQDMKCIKIHNGAIESIMLNEACSSGCGSFIESFASTLGYNSIQFAKLGLFAKSPASLGTRCTVFMNSAVKQAQKEGATVEDVAAGIATSVVKNALYKVLRILDPKELGENIIVQGGTFLNDAVVRAFEKETGVQVTRPNIAGVMGAYGAALLAKRNKENALQVLSKEIVDNFSYRTISSNCKLCSNNCLITINIFPDGRRYISGNKCERGLGKENANPLPNTFLSAYERLISLPIVEEDIRGEIGIPLVLNFFDTYPFWNAFFNHLRIKINLSHSSSGAVYSLGQHTIPSDTVCYPAKLVHGHIIRLINSGVKNIFYPIIVYNFAEKNHIDNHYNCPVVAYYPELIAGNVEEIEKVNFITPYLEINSPKFLSVMIDNFKDLYNLTTKQIKEAIAAGNIEYNKFKLNNRILAQEAIHYAQNNNLKLIVLAGRPYHLDPGINQGVAKLITTLGAVVVAEDHISHLADSGKVKVLNQWTYHSRLYDAATYVTTLNNAELVQLVSFGCGIDAITSDETRHILEEKGKLYTQLKIDEISNMGASKIRLRSLFSAMEEKEKSKVKLHGKKVR